MPLSHSTIYQLLVSAGLIFLAVLWRLINNDTMLLPNLELVTAASLVAAVYLRRPFALAVPLVAMALSDWIIGGAGLSLFTWSAFLLIALVGSWLKRFRNSPHRLILATGGTGLVGALFFFAWTNFGVWLVADGSFYPHTWDGLLLCYTYGLPFLRGSLVSGLIAAPILMAVAVVTTHLRYVQSQYRIPSLKGS